MWQLHRNVKNVVLLALAVLTSTPAWGADGGFSGGITPTRFELTAKPGTVVRKSLKIYNMGARPTQFRVSTADWDYSPDGQISFQNELADNSCREWVALERRKISVVPDPQKPRNFRFEITVPEDAPTRECRFAVMLDGESPPHETSFNGGAVTLPITGRIAVVVYLGVGDVEPEIAIGQLSMRKVNRKLLPVVQVQNQGDAHGRLDADLVAHGQDGRRVPLSIASSPIMPGQTRYLALTPHLGYELSFPLTVKGNIYSDEHSISVEQTLHSQAPELIAQGPDQEALEE